MLNSRFSAPAALSRFRASARFCLRCLIDLSVDPNCFQNGLSLPSCACAEHHTCDLLRTVDRQGDGSADARIAQRSLIAPHAELSMCGHRLGVVRVPRVVLEGLSLLWRELHRQVDLPGTQGKHEGRAALVERNPHTIERRAAAPVRVVADELGAPLVDVAPEPERPGADHAARDPRAGLRHDRSRLDDRLIRRLAEQVRESPERRLEADDNRVSAASRNACGVVERGQAGVRAPRDVVLQARHDVRGGHLLAVVEPARRAGAGTSIPTRWHSAASSWRARAGSVPSGW